MKTTCSKSWMGWWKPPRTGRRLSFWCHKETAVEKWGWESAFINANPRGLNPTESDDPDDPNDPLITTSTTKWGRKARFFGIPKRKVGWDDQGLLGRFFVWFRLETMFWKAYAMGLGSWFLLFLWICWFGMGDPFILSWAKSHHGGTFEAGSCFTLEVVEPQFFLKKWWTSFWMMINPCTIKNGGL